MDFTKKKKEVENGEKSMVTCNAHQWDRHLSSTARINEEKRKVTSTLFSGLFLR